MFGTGMYGRIISYQLEMQSVIIEIRQNFHGNLKQAVKRGFVGG
jgi:hypothetical protein